MAEPSSREALLRISRGIFSEIHEEGDLWGGCGRRSERFNVVKGGLEVVEGYAMRDHIHMPLMIQPKFSVSHTVGYLKGKSAIRIFREYLQVKRNFAGRHF